MTLLSLTISSFTGTCVYALCFPSLAPFLKELDGSSAACGCNHYLGLAVAIFSLGKAITAPLTGYVTERAGAKVALLLLTLLLAGSQLLYALSPSVATVVVARALMGIAGTTSTVCRTAVAGASASRDERARLTAAVSAASNLGFVLGPALGGLLFLIPGVALRSPGWLGFALAGTNLLAVLFFPPESPVPSSSLPR